MITTKLQKLARDRELTAVDLAKYPDQELLRAYKRNGNWYKMRSVNRARITMELMNRGLIKTYQNNG